MKKYVFDDSFSARKERKTLWNILRGFLKYVLVTVSLAVVYYVLFALVFSTGTERKLRRENRMYEKTFPQMEEKMALIGDVITGLQIKDNQIYRDIFDMDAPGLDPVGGRDFFSGSDSIPSFRIQKYSRNKSEILIGQAERVEDNFRRVMEASLKGKDTLPPLALPVKQLSYAQVGASIGLKVNPFYKVPVEHKGLDIIAPQGSPVLAAGDGIVSNIILSRKGQGNVVEISHSGGYVTRYCHLEDIEVRKGQPIRSGRRIAYVGISGNSFAPHLHFEVLKDGEVRNPVNYFFAAVSPDEYANMLLMASETGQSLD